MSSEMVFRAAILKQQRQWTYKELEFHLADLQSGRAFVKLPFSIYYSDSSLQENIKEISFKIWEKINIILLKYAGKKDMRKDELYELIALWWKQIYIDQRILL
ncbi:hypothetical protein [Fluviispira sanaruensis]|uniref:Uncharacterized protein n=1 Tax=Fluviispira sanaruensis TaxID=2493639 RepID=A0A4P2VL15_FLUSA|nr:hypothetical protein [Fluviispira sanaruensis]BBH53986.1 hypothetical protein JCM31447_24400 [Fluviispira sanaruensis]